MFKSHKRNPMTFHSWALKLFRRSQQMVLVAGEVITKAVATGVLVITAVVWLIIIIIKIIIIIIIQHTNAYRSSKLVDN